MLHAFPVMAGFIDAVEVSPFWKIPQLNKRFNDGIYSIDTEFATFLGYENKIALGTDVMYN